MNALSTDPNMIEEPCFYVFQTTLTANQPKTQQPVSIDQDSDFLLTGIHGTATGAYSINFRLPSGRMLANTQVSKANLVGDANQPTAIGPMQPYARKSSGPAIDITDTSGAGNTIEIVFSGIRLVKRTV